MGTSEAASIDIIKLSASLRENFKTVYPLSKDRCIYRVPQSKRCLNPSDYTPQIVSIGPYHHGKKALEAMEAHKIRYLQHFLQLTNISIEEFLTLIKDRETKLRSCYADIIELKRDEFVRLILVDAVFLIEYFWRGCKRDLITDDDILFRAPWLDVRGDLWLVENQIPLFILNDLFNLAQKGMDHQRHIELSLIKITRWFWDDIVDYVPVEKNVLERNFPRAKHFLDLLYLCFQSPQRSEQTELKDQNIPSAKELHQAGVRIVKSVSNKNLLDITFNKGILEIPFLKVYDGTVRIYRNIIAFENVHYSNNHFNDYVLTMSYLVNTAKDAELLVQNGVIGHRHSQTLSTVFENLNENCSWSADFQYSGLVGALQAHCKSPWNKWKANLKQNYFNTPWASISVAAAVILLLLTVIQTTCSIIQL